MKMEHIHNNSINKISKRRKSDPNKQVIFFRDINQQSVESAEFFMIQRIAAVDYAAALNR